MRIVTWNINSIRLRQDLLVKLIKEHQPDIIALQETKVVNELFPEEFLKKNGYNFLYYDGQKSYNGVAIISRIPAKKTFITKIYDDSARHIGAYFDDFEFHNFYVPAGGDIPDAEQNLKFDHKLKYVDGIKDWFKSNRSYRDKIILAGDLNIAPFEHDVWSSRQLRNVVSHTDIEREKLLSTRDSMGFIDSARHFVDHSEKFYSWWSYRNRDWKKSNRGRRLDHIWVSKNLEENLRDAKIVRGARDWPRPSDHVPYIVDMEF